METVLLTNYSASVDQSLADVGPYFTLDLNI